MISSSVKAHAKATRSGNSLRLEARGAFNASFVASASQSARAFLSHFFGTFAGEFSPAFVAVLVVLWNICGRISGICCYFGGFVEHLPGDFPAFVVVLAVFWNICRSFTSCLWTWVGCKSPIARTLPRVSAPSCFRARNAALKQVGASVSS